MNSTKKTGGQLYGIVALLFLALSTTLCFIPIFIIGLIKLFPSTAWKARCVKMIDAIAVFWSEVNYRYISLNKKLKWEITGVDSLSTKDWYLVMANHQSWLDIVVLQCVFNRKIPVLKFFIKDQLKWVPFLGFAWWAMGCPFMKRYSKDYLAKKPHKKGKDLEATRKAIRAFKHNPSAVMNFVEGTRYTSAKSKHQQSPYQHLLKPRAGGVGFVISAMGQQFNSLLDATIVYPSEQCSLWDFLCHRIDLIKVNVRQLRIPDEFTNAANFDDEKTQIEFRNWINNNWQEKDKLIAELKTS